QRTRPLFMRRLPWMSSLFPCTTLFRSFRDRPILRQHRYRPGHPLLTKPLTGRDTEVPREFPFESGKAHSGDPCQFRCREMEMPVVAHQLSKGSYPITTNGGQIMIERIGSFFTQQ